MKIRKYLTTIITISIVATFVPAHYVYANADAKDDATSLMSEEVEEHTNYFCEININYTKETANIQDMVASPETLIADLNMSTRIEAGTVLEIDIYDEDVSKILAAADMPKTLNSGYDIEAAIDIDGNVTIKSITATDVIEEVIEIPVFKVMEKDLESEPVDSTDTETITNNFEENEDITGEIDE